LSAQPTIIRRDMTPTHPNLCSIARPLQPPLIAPRHGIAVLLLFAFIAGLVGCGGVKESSRKQQPDIADYNFSIGKLDPADSIRYEELPAIEVLPTIYQPALRQINDLRHTRLDVRFDWDKKHLIGKAVLTLQPHFYAVDSLSLDAKSFDIHSLELVGLGTKPNVPLRYTYRDSLVLDIKLDRSYRRDETYQIAVSYTAQPERLVNHPSGRFHYDNKGLYFIMPDSLNPSKPYQIWTQGETFSSSCWFPTIDAPNQKTTQEITITVADKYKTLSNGKLISSTANPDGTRSDYWKQALPHAPYLFTMAIGDYAVIKDKWRDIEVNYYVEPPYAASARAIFGNTPDMLTFFSQRLGVDFPWEKYSQAVVRDFIAGAMENTSATLFYERLQRDERELLEGNDDDIIAHELFHHWFGDLVTCESWANLALNESFATYGEYLWFEHKYGRDEADAHLNKDLRTYLSEAEQKQEPIIRYYYSNADDDLFDAHSYQKGGRVLHMLRYYVGDEAFFAAIAQYLKAHSFKTAEINDLRMAFESVTGEDLNWFFDQWMMSKGHPELDISYNVDTTKGYAAVIIQQTQAQEKVYQLPTSIEIVYPDGSKERHAIRINKRQQTFTFALKKTPKLINFDPDRILLCERTDRKTIQGYLHQYYDRQDYLNRFESLQALEQIAPDHPEVKQLIRHAATQDPYYGIRREALQMITLDAVAADTSLQKSMIRTAQTDPKALVREAALSRLAHCKSPEFYGVFGSAMRDSSYQVVYTALQNLFELNPEKAVYYAQLAENTANSTLLNAIAHIYAQAGKPNNSHFFEKNLPLSHTYSRYALIEFYGTFLMRCNDDATTAAALPTLQKIAQYDQNWWIRLRTAELLRDIRELYRQQQQTQLRASSPRNTSRSDNINIDERLQSIETLIKSLKANEKDKQVLSFYETM
jgi:aminopeptidase N